MSSIGLVAELERLAIAIGAQKPGDEEEISLPSVAERISKALGVKPDEVAILAVSMKWRHLHFLVPQALKNVGFIPLSSPSAAGRAHRAGKSRRSDNRFHETRHASVFEGVKNDALIAEAIRKIVSAPITVGDKVLACCRSAARERRPPVRDRILGRDEVTKIAALCRPLGKLIQHLTGE